MCKKEEHSMSSPVSTTTASNTDTTYTWEEVRKHTEVDDKWLVVDGNVYDITKWAKRHPGGNKVISHYSGQDATDAFGAFHRDRQFVNKFLKLYRIGRVDDDDNRSSELAHDFDNVRELTKTMDLYKPNFWFYAFQLGHIIALEVLAYATVRYFGANIFSFLLAGLFMGTSQTQGAWLNHDFGHLSVFKSTKLNYIVQEFVFAGIQGAPASWWKYRHYQHHAKPNVINKDPDIKMEIFFLVGDTVPKEVAKAKTGFMPYQHQHKYFPFLLPIFLIPVYYTFEFFRYVIKRREWVELTLMIAFFVRLFYLFAPFLGFVGALLLFMLARTIQSTWFVWVSQANHIPMAVEHDEADQHWVQLQMNATCNLESSTLIDWFTGHLNYQVEHHLFPTMPRHNLHKIRPYVQSMCEKHNIPYIRKPFWTAMADILRSLKKSGNKWYELYNMLDPAGDH
ncbi:acyl-CoA 6-desaturase [Strongylocentrotus purpuratus]|uniref:Cytochrome b5 heme-binding domain-containing protein n=1 Tax=Strongylocentrotus purpuratus TaxID=7668 RepID=A0A7M7NE43_STRPU|nr:acyl-CoA 6-desaturase [Strongylocentrotus purpuratus]